MTWRSLVLALSIAAALAGIPVSAMSPASAPDLRLAIWPEPRRAKVGDEVGLDLALTNLGTRRYENGSLGEDDCALGFDLTVIGPDGREVPDARGGIVGSCLGGLQELLPGATAHGRISLNRENGLPSPRPVSGECRLPPLGAKRLRAFINNRVATRDIPRGRCRGRIAQLRRDGPLHRKPWSAACRVAARRGRLATPIPSGAQARVHGIPGSSPRSSTPCTRSQGRAGEAEQPMRWSALWRTRKTS